MTFDLSNPNALVVAFIRPLAPAVGHILVEGKLDRGYVEDAVALCGFSTAKAEVDVAVVCDDSLKGVDCKRCLAKYAKGNFPGPESEASIRRGLVDKLFAALVDLDYVTVTPLGGTSGEFVLDVKRAKAKVDEAMCLLDPDYERHAKGPNHALPCRYCGG